MILGALSDVIGDDQLEKLLRFRENLLEAVFSDYAVQYVDKCSLEYIKTAPEKRSDKLRNLTKRIIQKPTGYQNMQRDI